MAKKRREDPDYFICPCCGAEVAVGSPVCRECGASDEFGWDDGDWSDDELPIGYSSDETFDYDKFVSEEFPDRAQAKYRWKRKAVALVVLITCVAFFIWAWTQQLGQHWLGP